MKKTLFLKIPGKRQTLRDFPTNQTDGYRDKREAKDKLTGDIEALQRLQDVLNAQAEHGVLIIFQGMDGAGKDSAIKRVMSGVNPQGVSVCSFKQPSEEEHRHDYLWRAAKAAPERGRIGIFNRSHYEEVLVTRVHPELLNPRPRKINESFWKRRFREINDYERYLVDNNITVIKFFLHLSKKEQAKRLLARLKDPAKCWKFSSSDVQQRAFWPQYMSAYEDMLNQTSTPWSPWYVIPADHKWFAHVVIAEVIVRRLRSLKLAYPKVSAELRGSLRKYRRKLEKES